MQQNSTAPQPDDTIPGNPAAATLARARRVADQLESVGIRLGGFRLSPPLGDKQLHTTQHGSQARCL